jgi:hypothetical protein
MNERIAEAIHLSHAEIITAAAAKLGRELSLEERAGIERVNSLMMLESVSRALSFEQTSASQVEPDLRYYASRSA